MSRDLTRLRQEPLTVFGVPVAGAALIPMLGQEWFVDPNADVFVPKKKWGRGTAQDRPFRTLAEALAACNTGDRIYIMGDIREEGLICSNLKFDVQIVGVGGLHHPDQPTTAYHPGAAMIRPPASPTADTPLINVRGRGWQFHNIAFDAPVDEAAVILRRNALSGASEYDASHAVFRNCRFLHGLRAIEDDGGCYNVTIADSQLAGQSGCAIINTSTAVANPLNWKILRNLFPGNVSDFGNAQHIDSPLNCAIIKRNVFGTVRSTGIYIDLTGGNANVVAKNILGGVYNTSDYVAGTGDLWLQNAVAVVAVTAPDGLSLAAPAAP